MNRELDGPERVALAAAQADLQPLRTLIPNDPRVLFALGLIAWLEGRDDAQSVQYLVDAAVYDRAPRRGNATTNDIVRRIARGQQGVTLLDVDLPLGQELDDER